MPNTLTGAAASSRARNRGHIPEPTPSSVYLGRTGIGVIIRKDGSCFRFDAGSTLICKFNTCFATPKTIDDQPTKSQGHCLMPARPKGASS
jgi:hypothetical protein